MANNKHTPGPWHVGKDHEAGISKGYFVGGGGCVRANMVGPAGNQEANARLIAAAPDILEALRQMVANAEADGKTYRSCYTQAVAAIAKAEGL